MDLISIALAFVLVAANGFFVATEFARLRPGQVRDWVRAGRPGAKSVQHAVEHIDAYLAACQLGITLEGGHEATVGGVVLEHMGRLPEPGEEVSVDGVRFQVLAAKDAQIQELRLLRDAPPGG